MLKKIGSWILTGVLVFSMLPVNAVASENMPAESFVDETEAISETLQTDENAEETEYSESETLLQEEVVETESESERKIFTA